MVAKLDDLPVAPPMPQPVAVVIVSWNSAAGLGPCLKSVVAEQPAEVLVIDNGSCDRTVPMVRQAFPEVRVIPLARNEGFARGCNLGVALSTAPYVLFLNDDAILQPGYLRTLTAVLDATPTAASATGKLVEVRRGQRYIDSAGIELCAHALRPLDRGYGEVDRGQYDRAEDIFGPSGAAALYRRAALAALSDEPFDVALFAYYEDVDLAWRLRRQGWRHLYVPDAVAQHRRRGPTNKPATIAAQAFVNRYVVWLKNESLARFAAYGPLAVAWELVRLARLGRKSPATLGRILERAARLRPRAIWQQRRP